LPSPWTRRKSETASAPAVASTQLEGTDERRCRESPTGREDIGFYASALDGDKKPVKTIASNAGHLLWSGIVRPGRARRAAPARAGPVERLGHPHALGEEPGVKPVLVPERLVWPHDNGIIAMGFKRYGFAREAAKFIRDHRRA
jgi:glycogen debranching enzyme